MENQPILINLDEEQSLHASLALSKKIKIFEKSLGIRPTKTLSKVSNDKEANSQLWLWLQKKGTLALRKPIDIYFLLAFQQLKETMPLSAIRPRGEDYSVYARQENEFSGEEAQITPSFALTPRSVQAEVIAHEDLHQNIDMGWENGEAVVTPLGWIVALEFFKQEGDATAQLETEQGIQYRLSISRELISLTAEMEKFFSVSPHCEKTRAGALKLIKKYPAYAKSFFYEDKDLDPDLILEAKLSHDFAYYKYFDMILGLYKNIGGAKILFAYIKNAPHDVNDLEEYFAEILRQYSAATKQ